MSTLKKFELGLNELESLIKFLPKTGVIVLRGDLASGKTTLVKEFVKSFHIQQNVTSPTFNIMQNYGQIYHYDIYRVGFNGLKQSGLFENLFEDGIHIVEWGDDDLIELLRKFEVNVCVVDIKFANEKRIYEVKFA